MLTEAVLEGHIAANPCTRIRLPRRTTHDRGEMLLLSREDFAAIIDNAPEHYRPLLLTLAGTGIRWGEAEALEVRDINFKLATMRINKAAKWDTRQSQRVVGPTKTKHSDRTRHPPATVVEALRPLVEGKKRSDRVFIAPRGGPLRHKSVLARGMGASVRESRTHRPAPTHPRPPPLTRILADRERHEHARRRPARLGHHSITVTADIYGHLSPDIQRAAADAAELISPLAIEG